MKFNIHISSSPQHLLSEQIDVLAKLLISHQIEQIFFMADGIYHTVEQKNAALSLWRAFHKNHPHIPLLLCSGSVEQRAVTTVAPFQIASMVQWVESLLEVDHWLQLDHWQPNQSLSQLIQYNNGQQLNCSLLFIADNSLINEETLNALLCCAAFEIPVSIAKSSWQAAEIHAIDDFNIERLTTPLTSEDTNQFKYFYHPPK